MEAFVFYEQEIFTKYRQRQYHCNNAIKYNASEKVG